MNDQRKLLSRNAFAASALTLVGVLGGGGASARAAGDECLARQSPLQPAALCAGIGAPASAMHAAHYRGAASDGVRVATITTASAHRNLQPWTALTTAQEDAAEPEVAYA
ncbi:hypothetical protein [Xylophilus sp. Leaf220]|uniref:hypothetical protein n=1 Tax=Xylophilus sp. Leaf220 TaxID=1735686 RepID=UPI000701093D|nr:hypothetical protein [Xylophilus sp. Leaf220]KQM80315.1 hypothetical protein ASE76_04020 [Xylophilus sp. Leaf220]